MAKQRELQKKLCDVLGSKHVYFQPPESIKLVYPCIVYRLETPEDRHANNRVYISNDRWTLTLIEYNPLSTVADDLVSHFSMCRKTQRFTADNLYHTTLQLYY